MSHRWLSVTLAFIVSACACATTAEQRVVIELVRPSSDAVQIAKQASQAAQVPVRYIAATSERWHAIALQCRDEVQCTRAVERLRADTSTYARVDLDQRRHVHSP